MTSGLVVSAEQAFPMRKSNDMEAGQPKQVRLNEDNLQEHDRSVGATRRQSVASSSSQLGMVRRRSTLRNLSQSLGMLRRMSLRQRAEEPPQPKLHYENTYKTDPDSDTKFAPHKIRPAVESCFKTYLDEVKYNQKECGTLTCDLAQVIKNRVKELDFKRYKIVCNVLIGQKKDQGIEATSRCIWDEKTDNYCCVYYQNDTLFAVAMIHGLYLE